MTGGSIARCVADDTNGWGNHPALWVLQASLILTGVAIHDCHTTQGTAIMVSGFLELHGCHLARLGSLQPQTAWQGALALSSGSLLLEGTLIEGYTDEGPEPPPEAGCLEVSNGQAILRNTTLSRCTHTTEGQSAYLRVAAAAQLVASALTIVTNCSHVAAASQPVIEAHGSAARPLALRWLRVQSSSTCDASTLLAPGTTIAQCSELPASGSTDLPASCGPAATCTDELIFAQDGASALTSAECTCTGTTFARDTPALSAALLPYSAQGCFTQRRARTLSVAGVTTSSVIFHLTKSAQGYVIRACTPSSPHPSICHTHEPSMTFGGLPSQVRDTGANT